MTELTLKHLHCPTFNEFTVFFLARFASLETRRSYQATLKEFYECILAQQCAADGHLRIIAFTEDTVLPYLRLLETKHRLAGTSSNRRAQTTIARKLSTMRSFFSIAVKKGFLQVNPFENIPMPKVPRLSRTQSLSPEETGKILLAVENMFAKAKAGSRFQRAAELSYAVILVLLTTGLRVSELCSLRVGDFFGKELYVIRKGGFSQKILLHPLTTAVMVSYKEAHRAHALEQEYFFVRSQQCVSLSKLSSKAVWLMVKKAALAAGIEKLPSPHTFRATLATELHRQGVLLHRIQDLLGHTSVSTTALYIKKLNHLADSPSVKLRVLETKI